MTPEEQAIVDRKLKEVAKILYNNTFDSELKTFETIELRVRDHLLKTVAPKIGKFFSIYDDLRECAALMIVLSYLMI